MSPVTGKVVVVGGGGHAKVLVSVLRRSGWQVLGYTDLRDRGAILGAPYLGEDTVLAGLLATQPDCRAALGLGKMDCSPDRLVIQAEIEALGYDFAVVLSPRAVVNEEVVLGAGTAVFDGAVVNSGTMSGKACIFNTNCTVEHDCRLADNVHVAPGATVCGGVTIGRDCFIGAGATIVQGVAIAAGSCVGAGAVVIGPLDAPGVYVGNPAARIRPTGPGQRP